MSILVLNAGSSTLKFSLFDDSASTSLFKGIVRLQGQTCIASLELSNDKTTEKVVNEDVRDYAGAVDWILQLLDKKKLFDAIVAVGHRVVHGGVHFHQSTIVDHTVVQLLRELSPLAPLHNPPAVLAIETARDSLPDAIHIAVFDTSFFADLPERAITYPVPYEWKKRHGVRRFGFHGISHAYCASRAAEMMQRVDDPSLKLVVCHLGNGCSITAVKGGHPIATSMGFTPMEGLMMGTRGGSIDPGIILHMMMHAGYSAADLNEELNARSGLLGVSGVSADYRKVEKAAASGDKRSQLALDMFADRVRSTIGSMAVLLGGMDGLVFTAGIGENSADLRSRACVGLECLGMDIREECNQSAQPD